MSQPPEYPHQPPPPGGHGQPPPQNPGGGYGYGPPPSQDLARQEEADKMWGFLSYGSMFLGLPLFVVPMVQKDSSFFARYHAKQAGTAFILALVMGVVLSLVTMVTCGFGAVLFPIIFMPVATAIHGLVLVANGEIREPWGNFGLAEKMFGATQHRLPPSPYQTPPGPPQQGPPQQGPPQGPPPPGWGG